MQFRSGRFRVFIAQLRLIGPHRGSHGGYPATPYHLSHTVDSYIRLAQSLAAMLANVNVQRHALAQIGLRFRLRLHQATAAQVQLLPSTLIAWPP